MAELDFHLVAICNLRPGGANTCPSIYDECTSQMMSLSCLRERDEE